MKNIIIILYLIWTIGNVNAQVSHTNNTDPGTGNPFLGWNNAGASNPLTIKTEFNQPIHFYTNAGTNSLCSFKVSRLFGRGL